MLAVLAIATQAQTTCVDPLACNFTELGECEFLDDNGMPCVTEGCAIPGACNFNPEANINDGSCEFTSCLGCTDEAACNYDPEAVYLDLSCIYFVDCNGVCGGDWIEDECGNCYDVESLNVEPFIFSPCGAVGSIGPSQEDCDQAYSNFSVEVQNGFQQWVVPYTGTYEFELYGAEGGNGGQVRGRGAQIVFLRTLMEGDIIDIAVGQRGEWNCSGGGGGSTGVKLNGSLVAIAGAGGGTGKSSFSNSGFENGVMGPNGQNSYASNGELVAQGGANGSGGQPGSNPLGDWPQAGGGAGILGNGGAGSPNNGTAYGGLSTGEGGGGSSSCGSSGGFGFTGGGGSEYGGGGGGGYSGGGGGASAGDCNGLCYVNGGGGGSYWVDVELLSSVDGIHEGNGSVRIELMGGLAPICELGCVVEQACNFNPEATNDDGSCDFCFCGPGTEYDIEQGQCMIVNGSSDINGDGCTNLNDLLDLLSGYGICED